MKRARYSFPGMGRRLGGGYSVAQVARYAAQNASSYARKYASPISQYAMARLANRTGSAGAAITTQHDVSTRYRRKAMPRRRRKCWVRFTKRINHVIMRNAPLQSLSFDDCGAVISWVGNNQATDGILLGGTNAGSQSNELLRMFQAWFGATGNTAAQAARKLYVKSICLDIQMTNTGGAGCIVDVYHLVCRKGYNGTTVSGVAPTQVVDGVPLNQQYDDCFDEQGTLSIGAVDRLNPSTTPFQNSPFCSIWKIVKKTQILLGAGQVTTLQYRNSRPRTIEGKVLEMYPSQIPGYTTGVLFQFRGVPENNAGTPRLAAGAVTWRGQKTLTFAVPPGGTRDATAQQ